MQHSQSCAAGAAAAAERPASQHVLCVPPPAGLLHPTRFHHMVPPFLTAGRRVLIVGDLHGCFDELQASTNLSCGPRSSEAEPNGGTTACRCPASML